MKSDNQQLREQILRLLSAPKYRPLDKLELGKALGRKSGVRMGLNEVLRQLEQSGEIARIRKNRYVLPSEADLVTGTLHVHQAGYAFLSTGKPGEQDLFIAAENTGTAMHGDKVVARITRDERYSRAKSGRERTGGPRDSHPRTRARFASSGLCSSRKTSSTSSRMILASSTTFTSRFRRSRRCRRPRARGDKVVVRLETWESRHVNPEGQIIEILGPSSAPGVDMLSIIRKYHLPTEFPKEVLEEAQKIPETVGEEMFEGREDLRDQFIVTIDPDDARDFDDAINVERIPGGGWNLGVHIADVSAYVKPGAALDREAYKRGNSVYLPDRVIPMLPERLSNGVCSLNPGVNRLTHSVFIQFTKDGRTKSSRFARTVIRSARRLTYREAYAILQAAPHDQLSERLHVAWELASLLRKKRFEQGSLDLDFPEVKVRLDEQGKPILLERIENDESHQLVEEFMLAANEAVARELKNRSIPTIYRVHENPEPDKLAEYRELVLSYNYKAGDLTNRKELQRLLASLTGKPEEQALKIGLLKSLKRARYAAQPLGHFGLAKTNYTHFTSPIRRYADLVVHRALAGRATRLAPASRAGHGPDRFGRRTYLDHGTRGRRGRDGFRENEEARVFSAPTRRARSASFSRDRHRCPELWTPARIAGRAPDRAHPCFLADGRLLCFPSNPTPIHRPAIPTPVFRGRSAARFRCAGRCLQAPGGFCHRERNGAKTRALSEQQPALAGAPPLKAASAKELAGSKPRRFCFQFRARVR